MAKVVLPPFADEMHQIRTNHMSLIIDSLKSVSGWKQISPENIDIFVLIVIQVFSRVVIGVNF